MYGFKNNKMLVARTPYWGLVQQRGPWKESALDRSRLRQRYNPGQGDIGGTKHAGHADWKVVERPVRFIDGGPSKPSEYAQDRIVVTAPPISRDKTVVGYGRLKYPTAKLGFDKSGKRLQENPQEEYKHYPQQGPDNPPPENQQQSYTRPFGLPDMMVESEPSVYPASESDSYQAMSDVMHIPTDAVEDAHDKKDVYISAAHTGNFSQGYKPPSPDFQPSSDGQFDVDMSSGNEEIKDLKSMIPDYSDYLKGVRDTSSSGSDSGVDQSKAVAFIESLQEHGGNQAKIAKLERLYHNVVSSKNNQFRKKYVAMAAALALEIVNEIQSDLMGGHNAISGGPSKVIGSSATLDSKLRIGGPSRKLIEGKKELSVVRRRKKNK